MFAGAGERLEREQQARAWQAWHTAVIPRMKTVPELNALMGVKPKLRIQTVDEMKAVFATMRRRGSDAVN